MKAFVFIFAAAGCFGNGLALAQQTTTADLKPQSPFLRAALEKRANENPTYSTAIFMHRDPHEWLSEREAELDESSDRQHTLLAYAAKAAWRPARTKKRTIMPSTP